MEGDNVGVHPILVASWILTGRSTELLLDAGLTGRESEGELRVVRHARPSLGRRGRSGRGLSGHRVELGALQGVQLGA